LCFLPSLRLSIPEIKAHKWYLGEVATHEEVKAEMEKRKKHYSLIS